MKKIILVCLLVLGGMFGAFAQQDPIYSQYMFNGITLNPGYAGNKGVLNFNAIYRTQWTGIAGSPTTMTFSADAPVANNNIGLGFYTQNDKLGAESRISAYGAFAYKAPLSFNSSLSFGLSFGALQYSFDGSRAVSADGTQAASSSSDIKPDARFGVYFSQDNLYIGASVSNLLAESVTINDGSGTTLNFTRQYYLTAGYIYTINDLLKIYPSILYKEDFRSPTDIDFNTFVLLKNTIWLGVSYRTAINWFNKQYESNNNLQAPNAVVIILQAYLNERLRVGYAYDLPISDISAIAGSTHEISLAYILPVSRRAKMLSPRYF